MRTMTNVRGKFASARKCCPGMSEDMYLLTDYMSENVNDELYPQGLMISLVCIRDDLERGRNGVGGAFPEAVNARRQFILNQMGWIPQVVDAIADEDFAKEFRAAWKEVYGTEPPKRLNTEEIKTEKVYPENVRVAVDWWANAVISPKFDNGEELPGILAFIAAGAVKQYTPEDIKLFKATLAEGISRELKEYGRCTLDVDYNPCRLLAEAGSKIGIDGLTGFPWKTYMLVNSDRVTVTAGSGAPSKVLWSK